MTNLAIQHSRGGRLYATGITWLLLAAGWVGSDASAEEGGVPPPRAPEGLRYTEPIFPGAHYRASVPTQLAILGFEAGERAASAAEVSECLRTWSTAAADRMRLVEYARSHEGRPLSYAIVTAPENLARLAEIRTGLARLADPRDLSRSEADRLIAELPAVAWLAYTIHGDETEGSDAALAVLYHLLASEDQRVEELLEQVVVVIDPLMNPDGRDRFVKMIAEHRGTAPNIDDQSLLHRGYWPRGRGNHYLFDLNRDWILGVHPETRGRIRELAKWHPQLFVDAHGMGAQNTHLFSPPREPINPNIPQGRRGWGAVFAREQAAAFDRHKLVYYTGEWHEEWYPGYSDAYASYRGAVGILYEQARVAADGVRRAEGRILSYRESMRHHVIGSMANLNTLKNHAKALLRYLYNVRKEAVDPEGPYAHRTFAVLPTANRSRLGDFVRLMQLQGVELHTVDHEFIAETAVDQLGRVHEEAVIPAGTLLIPNRQPLGNLVAGMLEFDPRLTEEVLRAERAELLTKGESRIYDSTAWNLSMFYGLKAFTLSTEPPASATPYFGSPVASGGVSEAADEAVAFVIDGADDRSVAVAARMMESGVRVRVAEKAFEFHHAREDARRFSRGSVVVTYLDNRTFEGDLKDAVDETSRDFGLAAVGVSSGFGPGDLPDLGGGRFPLLERPRIALLGRDGSSPYDYGAIWYVLDHRLGIRHSHLSDRSGADLSRYNVLIVPDRWSDLGDTPVGAAVKDWVEQGGTLVAIAGGARQFLTSKSELSSVRPLREVLDKLDEYELAIFREWLGQRKILPTTDAIWAHDPATDIEYPWELVDAKRPDKKELERRDEWQRLFMPQGAIVAARVNTNHWLTFGAAEMTSVLVAGQRVLMASRGVETPVRYGYLTGDPVSAVARESEERDEDAEEDENEGEEEDAAECPEKPARPGWSALPEGTRMHLRMSGLLWPEATHRIANAAWLTRESRGRGQIILFATPPTFRASTRGTERFLLNAVIYGPGLGARSTIIP